MYQHIGAISSELRALATEYNAVVWTATQTNRNGYDGDPDLKNTSESSQTNSIGDLIMGVVKEPGDSDRLCFRVLKTRDTAHDDSVFVVGVDPSRMKLYDVEQVVLKTMDAQRESIKATRESRSPKFADKRVVV